MQTNAGRLGPLHTLHVGVDRIGATALVTGLLLAPASPVLAQPEVLRTPGPVVAVVDTSGSMAGGLDWLARLVAETDRAIGSDGKNQADRYALVTFLDTPCEVPLAGERLGSSSELGDAILELRTHGGAEDGYRALRYAVERHGDELTLLLVTNEDRDVIDATIDFDALAALLVETGVTLDVLVNVEFACGDDGSGPAAIGMSADGAGWFAGPAGTVERCPEALAVGTLPAGQTSVADYVDLAHATGGSAWNLYAARTTSERQRPFVSALAAERLSRGGEALPIVAIATSSPGVVRVGDVVTLDGSASHHRQDGERIYAWEWDADGDGVFELSGPVVAAVFDEPGRYAVTLRVTDALHASVAVETRIVVGVVRD